MLLLNSEPTVYVCPFALNMMMEIMLLTAWSCHDCDDDGVPNAHEDTHGAGVWTPGEDFNEICSRGDFVKIKLQYNSVEKTWALYMTPDEGFEPTGEIELVSGRPSLLSSFDFFPSDI